MNARKSSNNRRFLRSTVCVAALAAALAVAQPTPARAGLVSDALGTMARWVSGIEQIITEWFDATIGTIKVMDREESAARAVAEMALQDPTTLAEIAGRAGFRLSTVSFADGGRHVDGLSFAYEQMIPREGRLALWRDVLEVEDTPFRPEMELVRLLLNASDMQENRAPAGLTLAGVAIALDDDTLTASWRFEPLPTE